MPRGPHPSAAEFWESPDQVARFAARAPDHRLADLLPAYRDPSAVRVLDIGCAGGRNAVLLASRGFDLVAIDSSEAMVHESRRRVAQILGAEQAEARVLLGRMADLTRWPDGAFDLVVALGVYHQAASQAEWDRAVSETRRVLKSEGRLLVSVFSPASVPRSGGGGGGGGRGRGRGRLTPVEGSPNCYRGFASGVLYLLDATSLDRGMGANDLIPAVPTDTVTVTSGEEIRVTVNALYRKAGGSS